MSGHVYLLILSTYPENLSDKYSLPGIRARLSQMTGDLYARSMSTFELVEKIDRVMQLSWIPGWGN